MRRSTSEDVASGTEVNEFVKNDKTHQLEIRELASALSGFIKQFRVEELKLLDGESSWKKSNQKSCNSRQFDVNSTFYSIRSTTLSTPFEYNTVQEILTNKQVSLSVTLKTAEISVMLP